MRIVEQQCHLRGLREAVQPTGHNFGSDGWFWTEQMNEDSWLYRYDTVDGGRDLSQQDGRIVIHTIKGHPCYCMR